MEKKIVIRNTIFSIVLQLVTMVSGFIVPRIIIGQFGSDVNGIISSVTQFLNYVQLIEGGLTGVAMANLYKPLSEGNMARVSSILKATQDFFRKIGLIYVVYALGVAFLYPLLADTGFDYLYGMVLVLVLAMNMFVQYFFSLSLKILINADRKGFYVSLTQIIITVLNTVSVVVCAKLFNDIIVIKFLSAIIYFIQPIMFSFYIKKHYDLDKNVQPDKTSLQQRWDGFGINLAYFIHTNTDVVILTLFSTFANVSVYSVYYMILKAVKNLVNSVSQAIIPSFGKTVAEGDKERMSRVFDLYEFVVFAISTVLFTCGAVCMQPFINVYTRGITDANYNRPLFGLLLLQAELVYCIRDPYVSTAYSAGHFKQVSKYAYVEAAINIVLSVVLVYKFNIIGIAVGTLVSMIYRMIMHVYYVKKNILMRDEKKAIKAVLIFVGIEWLAYFVIKHFVRFNVSGYVNFFIYAVITFIIVAVMVGCVCLIFYRNEVKKLLKR